MIVSAVEVLSDDAGIRRISSASVVERGEFLLLRTGVSVSGSSIGRLPANPVQGHTWGNLGYVVSIFALHSSPFSFSEGPYLSLLTCDSPRKTA